VINVNDTSLEDKGSTQVALALAESPCPLEELGMALNEITPQGTSLGMLWKKHHPSAPCFGLLFTASLQFCDLQAAEQ
jgi:hypothetical protein